MTKLPMTVKHLRSGYKQVGYKKESYKPKETYLDDEFDDFDSDFEEELELDAIDEFEEWQDTIYSKNYQEKIEDIDIALEKRTREGKM